MLPAALTAATEWLLLVLLRSAGAAIVGLSGAAGDGGSSVCERSVGLAETFILLYIYMYITLDHIWTGFPP